MITTALAVVALLAATLVGLTGAASAATAPSDQSVFSAQAEKAGLTSAQAKQLQAKVDSYLAKTGGTQVSANKISFKGGEVLVGAAGQQRPSDLARPAAKSAADIICYYGELCLTRGADWMKLYRCGTYTMPWAGDGYFVNNQTTGTVARFLNSNKTERWSSRAYEQGTATWTPVYYVVPC
ncbi:hypothetical protein [Streptomyces sp. NPDC005408]|uniref:hypothetical protein n=1 Tax=Streptomyces sp. NPDC005408 TaxID=3155341 RepID=UPI0033A6CDE8